MLWGLFYLQANHPNDPLYDAAIRFKKPYPGMI